jgi:shikimate kinase
MKHRASIALIGMPGVGKSTIGVLLAKQVQLDFLDTDIAIQTAEGLSLHGILNTKSRAYFFEAEERAVLAVSKRPKVIATGGSVVYSDKAMQHLAAMACIVHLKLGLKALTARLDNLATRGIVMQPGQSLASLKKERDPLYRQYADITIGCDGQLPQAIVDEIKTQLCR